MANTDSKKSNWYNIITLFITGITAVSVLVFGFSDHWYMKADRNYAELRRKAEQEYLPKYRTLMEILATLEIANKNTHWQYAADIDKSVHLYAPGLQLVEKTSYLPDDDSSRVQIRPSDKSSDNNPSAYSLNVKLLPALGMLSDLLSEVNTKRTLTLEVKNSKVLMTAVGEKLDPWEIEAGDKMVVDVFGEWWGNAPKKWDHNVTHQLLRDLIRAVSGKLAEMDSKKPELREQFAAIRRSILPDVFFDVPESAH